ncbi:hypothetical protein [Candidatus Protochlamydia amoebophila]|uniref:Uncharacterized protein n=1 Tax=Candidatus Protochlamydia amoebophila TaxID=362787 RepID=A0A0C1JQA2_9BACT|nr:hypothetical protein [Candidatus Protochlamydia amoebophila]KIC72696.1 hypothetical protein DB44_CB00010 [Candidatus Protochlamydia amoebophila]
MDTGFVTPDWSNALPSYAQDEYLPAAIKKVGGEAFAEPASNIDQPLTRKDSVSAFAAESLFNHLEENISPLKEHYFTVGVNSKVNNVQKQVIPSMEDEAKIQKKLTESLNSLQSSFQQLVQQIRQQQF